MHDDELMKGRNGREREEGWKMVKIIFNVWARSFDDWMEASEMMNFLITQHKNSSLSPISISSTRNSFKTSIQLIENWKQLRKTSRVSLRNH